MKRVAALILALALCSGCAAFQKIAGERSAPSQAEAQGKRLASAVALLQQGNNPGAVKALEAICAAPAVPGVTDEALFRLALLTLKASAERPASSQAGQLLKRLKKEYPASPWTLQAQPLVGIINSAEEARRQVEELRRLNRNYKSENHKLSNEIRELNSSIEKLKHLDLELERKGQ